MNSQRSLTPWKEGQYSCTRNFVLEVLFPIPTKFFGPHLPHYYENLTISVLNQALTLLKEKFHFQKVSRQLFLGQI